MSDVLIKNVKLTKEFLEDGFSFNSLKQLSIKNEGLFSTSTLEYYVIILVFNEITIEIEHKKYHLKPNEMVFIGPEKQIKFLDVNYDDVFIISFSSHFYEKSAKDSFILNSNLFFDCNYSALITPLRINSEGFKTNVLERLQIMKEKRTDLYLSFAHNFIERFILEGLYSIQDMQFVESKDFSSLKIANQFKVQLHKTFKTQKTVQYYADILNITPRKLSEICEEVLGKTAKQLILDKVLSETTRMVRNTDLTISEIAFELGFTDEANFSKLIKKHSGKTPKQLRVS